MASFDPPRATELERRARVTLSAGTSSRLRDVRPREVFPQSLEVSISASTGSNFAVVLTLALAACSAPQHEDDSPYKVGVLLPYTGDDAASGASLERGLLMAYHTYQEAGGADLSLVYRDASDDPARAAREAKELADEGVIAVVGPGPDNLAGPVLDVLLKRRVPLLSPVATTAQAHTFDAEHPWIRVSVPATILARTLATRLSDQGVRSIRVVAAQDAFHEEFGNAFVERARSLGIEIKGHHSVDERQQSFGKVVSSLAHERDGILVAMNPLPAARLINEVVVSDSRSRDWFLGPRLKSDVFLLNVVPGALEGASGVSPDTLLNQEAFGERFAEAWDGDTPLEGAHFSYDAAALAFTAIDRLRRDGARRVEDISAGLDEAILDLADFGGVIVRWDNLREAISRNRSGKDWQFSGVTGPIVFAPDGARRSGNIAAWAVHKDEIVPVD